MSDSEPPKKRFCGHCKEYLCKTVYFQHKRLYFNKESNEWLPTQIFNKSPFDDAAFHTVSTAAEPKQASVLLTDDTTCELDDSDNASHSIHIMNDDGDSDPCMDPDDDHVRHTYYYTCSSYMQ